MGFFDPKQISTQEHLDIEDIRENLVILKNGRVSAVLETSSLNFDLLDPEEQDGRIGGFAAFLNSLRFPIQIVIKTQKTDIGKYLGMLESYRKRISNRNLNTQVEIYQEFISDLTMNSVILDKRFFVVIPSVRLPVITTSWLKQIFGKKEKIVNISYIVSKAKEELTPKADAISKQLRNMGVLAKQMTNDELIKLYYSTYEPDQIGLSVVSMKEKDIDTGLVSLKQ